VQLYCRWFAVLCLVVANIKFNRRCLESGIIPNYARIKIPTHNTAAKKTQKQAQPLRIKNEIKFLYRKKQQLNTQLYHKHIQSGNNWQHIWPNIEQSINQKLQREMVEIHKTQQQKIQTLSKTKTTDTRNNDNSYPRVVNTTDTQFTKEDIHLLHKGLQYNLHHKQKN
jgi:hypothetical protein